MSYRWLIALAACLLAAPGLSQATEWTIDHAGSRLGFEATQSGAAFDGEFEEFSAVMRFDPENLDQALFDVTVDVTSFDSSSSDRDSTVAGKEWFWSKRFPEARFVTTEFRALGGDRYETVGDLTIKGIGRQIVLPFAWIIDGDQATMQGDVTLNRTDFKVGEGDWAKGKTVGLQVDVKVRLALKRS